MSTNLKWYAGIAVTAMAFTGLLLGLGLWRRAWQRPRLEPAFLARAWYIDEGVSAAVSGPLARTASAFSFGVDAGLVDRGTTGIGRIAAGTGRQLRRLQTGYVRNYALGIGIGAAAVLAYVASRIGG